MPNIPRFLRHPEIWPMWFGTIYVCTDVNWHPSLRVRKTTDGGETLGGL